MIVVNNKKELKRLIYQRTVEHGLNCNLNDIDVSKIDDMSFLFTDSKFNGDISSWDVSNVEDMRCIFIKTPLDGNEPEWYRPW